MNTDAKKTSPQNTTKGKTSVEEPVAVSLNEKEGSDGLSQPVPFLLRLTVIALLTAGFLPLLSWHFYRLLERPHYQFAILIPIAAWLLSVAEIQQVQNKGNWKHPWFFSSLVFVGLVGLGAAVRFWTPWLAAVSFLVMMPALIWLLGGMAKLNQWFRGWVMCWMMIPLPFGLDQTLIVSLREITTRLTSKVLDQFHVLHLQYGNVIEVPGKQLFIADACSGIHSLYVLLAAALFIGLWLKRGVIHIALMLGGAFFFVILENVLRLFLVAALLKYKIDLSAGIKHVLLGGALFVGSLLLLVSFDQLIRFLISSKEIDNRKQWLEMRSNQFQKFVSQNLNWGTFGLFAIVAVLACGLGVVQVYQSRGELPNFSTLTQEDIDLPKFGQQGLPETIMGFKQADYKTIARVHGDPFGQGSQQWTYKKGDVTVLLSIDYPYDGIHDLCVCYSQIGWKIIDQKVLQKNEVQEIAQEEISPIAVGKLTRDLYGHGLLAFSFFDRQGNAEAVIKALVKQSTDEVMASRFANKRANKKSSELKLAPPFVQVQILARSPNALNDEQEQLLLRFFIEARSRLTKMSLEKLK